MPKNGYYWSQEEFQKLFHAWNEGQHDIQALAALTGRKPEAVKKKLAREGLIVVGAEKKAGTTTTKELLLPKELPNVEEILRVSAAALEALKAPGLDQSEVVRLRTIVQGVKIYKELLADFLDFAGLEKRLFELEAKYAVLIRKEKRSMTPRVHGRGRKDLVIVHEEEGIVEGVSE